jgi:hypothetical protein
VWAFRIDRGGFGSSARSIGSLDRFPVKRVDREIVAVSAQTQILDVTFSLGADSFPRRWLAGRAPDSRSGKNLPNSRQPVLPRDPRA